MDHGITISGLTWARRHKREFDRVLSVCDPMGKPGRILQFHERPAPPHLLLQFVDLDAPADAPWTDYRAARMATADQIEKALAFDEGGRMLIHCQAGISRSTAIGYAILAKRLGKGAEAEALAGLYRIVPDAVPNLHVTGLADRILQRDGALTAAIIAAEADRPECAERRREQRKAYHDHFTQGPWLRTSM